MAQKIKTREITIVDEGGTFSVLLRRLGASNKKYDFDSLAALRSLLSNEKARILNTIKSKSPSSVYQLAKILKRDFKSVSSDVNLLEKFGFIDLISEKTGKRKRYRPIVVVDVINLNIRI